MRGVRSPDVDPQTAAPEGPRRPIDQARRAENATQLQLEGLEDVVQEGVTYPVRAREGLFGIIELIGRRRTLGLSARKIEEQVAREHLKPKEAQSRIERVKWHDKKISKELAKVKAQAERLMLEGKTPEDSVYGIDVTRAFNQYQIGALQKIIDGMTARLQEEGVPDSEKTQISEGIQSLEKQAADIQKRVSDLQVKRDEIGKDLPNEVEQIVEVIAGRKLTDKEQQNPLGIAEEIMSEGVGNPEQRTTILQRLRDTKILTTDAQVDNVNKEWTATDHPDRPPVQKARRAALIGGGLAALVAVMVIRTAFKQEETSQRQTGYR